MNLFKTIRPVLAVLGLMFFSAVCAMAQAEINPDHFDDSPQQSPVIHKAPAHKAIATVTHPSQSAPKQQAQNNGALPAAKLGAHQGGAAGAENLSKHAAVDPKTGQKRHKKLVSEARHHGM